MHLIKALCIARKVREMIKEKMNAELEMKKK